MKNGTSATTTLKHHFDCLEASPQTNGKALKLSRAARLPTLANHCFIVGEAKRADVIWSEGDFLALCEHMLNENPPNHFLRVWIDRASQQPRFAKAPIRSRADKHAGWTWNTITGKAKVQTSIGFYPSNNEGKSRWAAIDFDAHNGEHEQARKRSLEAFSLLLQEPQYYLILCASGNGYHLFIYTRELYPVGQWIVLLKEVCAWIGAPIADGTCEIFPNERAELQPTGKGIRAPGTLNPKTGSFSLIEAQTVGPLLDTLPRTWTLGVGKVKRTPPRENTPLSLQKSTNTYFLTIHTGSVEPMVEAILARYPIAETGTRNNVLMRLIGDLIHKFGREAAERIIEEHYQRNRENVSSALDEHLREFATAWDGMRAKLVDSLSPAEQQAFDALGSEHQREGFLIVRAFAGAATHNGEKDFQISRASLADRLSITPSGAADVIRKLFGLKVIAQTQPYVRHKASARFCWLLSSVVNDSPRTRARAYESRRQGSALLCVLAGLCLLSGIIALCGYGKIWAVSKIVTSTSDNIAESRPLLTLKNVYVINSAEYIDRFVAACDLGTLIRIYRALQSRGYCKLRFRPDRPATSFGFISRKWFEVRPRKIAQINRYHNANLGRGRLPTISETNLGIWHLASYKVSKAPLSTRT